MTAAAPRNEPAAKAAPKAPIKAAQPGPGGSSAIKRLEARGGVMVTQKDQVVTGETAVFDTRTNLVTMQGNVVLTQGKNVLRGDRLTVDMTTGTVTRRIQQRQGPGHVRVVRPEGWRRPDLHHTRSGGGKPK